MPLFWFHEGKGLSMVIWSGALAGMRGSRGTLSPEIFGLYASCTMGERRFLHSASVEMTEGAGRLFCHWGREISPLRNATAEMTGMGGSVFVIRPLLK